MMSSWLPARAQRQHPSPSARACAYGRAWARALQTQARGLKSSKDERVGEERRGRTEEVPLDVVDAITVEGVLQRLLLEPARISHTRPEQRT
eukprot:3012924-Rhodomonas_salina.5